MVEHVDALADLARQSAQQGLDAVRAQLLGREEGLAQRQVSGRNPAAAGVCTSPC